jgi:Type VI secretion system (T6SS), amidase effector protein 4
MTKPSFKTLWLNYPKGNQASVYKFIGWDEFIGKPGYENTCAIRMSICLGLSGVAINSSAGMRALKGPISGKPIEIRQDKLSEFLESRWGAPMKCPANEGYKKIAGRDGVISFWKIADYNVGGTLGGHIDLIDGSTVEETDIRGRVIGRMYTYNAARGDYMAHSETIHFWEMPQ